MVHLRYTAWDGSQRVRLDPDRVFERLAEYLSETDDLGEALDRLLRSGIEGDEFEVEGLITRFVSPQDFDVANVAVTTTATTQYEHGSAASLRLDLRVHVSGRINAALELEAGRVEIED